MSAANPLVTAKFHVGPHVLKDVGTFTLLYTVYLGTLLVKFDDYLLLNSNLSSFPLHMLTIARSPCSVILAVSLALR